MIVIKTENEIIAMKESAKILSDTLKLLAENIKPGITTKQLDNIAYGYITKCGAQPSFLNYNGFPASICTSIDDEVIHGIPSKRRIEEGQIISVDAGVFYKGYHSDAARTYAVGKVSELKQKLIEVAEKSFSDGIKVLKEGIRLGDLGSAIQKTVEENGFSVVRDMVGHGIGVKLHEDPSVPNYGQAGRGLRLKAGMTLAIEPMINAGSYHIKVLEDKWTIKTCDGNPSAHYENTVLITREGAEILTA
ncbi:MAG: type I methionyl aminopeptidase [Clostridia bacterium]|nr:type I methionyl aminopeptidase [Clostridia bacterium]